ncbi:MAG: S-adenosylmethionine:tRNA ribosyltransferase-isomerase, partial [Thermomicrobiales bacterium]
IIETIKSQGIGIGCVTLHVGLDTFRPVTEDDARNHAIHREWCNVDSEVIDQMRSAKERGNRVIAVGTTTARTLETWAAATPDWNSEPYSGESSIYITPGYHWRIVDAMLTNFHLPRSTLLLMVSALASRDRILDAYQQAIEERFRFFSFGDAMLIV